MSEARARILVFCTSAAVLGAQLERYPDLPRDLDGLHKYCEEVRPSPNSAAAWFSTSDDGRVFRRGKHRGTALDEVARTAPGYLTWMLGADDMGEEVLRIVREALEK